MCLTLTRLMSHPSYSPVQKFIGKFGVLQVAKVLIYLLQSSASCGQIHAWACLGFQLSSILIIIWRVGVNLHVPRKQHVASPGGRGTCNHSNSATGQPSAPVTLIESMEQITLTSYLSQHPFYRGIGGCDNMSSSCMRDSARQPRNTNVPTGSLGYDVYPVNGTCDATSQLSSPD